MIHSNVLAPMTLGGHCCNNAVTMTSKVFKGVTSALRRQHKTHLCHPCKSVCDSVTAAVWQRASYHGFHRLPALGLRSRQEEIFGISPEIHPQVDVEVHSVTLLRINTYSTRSDCLTRTERLIWVNLACSFYCCDLASWTRPPRTMCPEVRSQLPR